MKATLVALALFAAAPAFAAGSSVATSPPPPDPSAAKLTPYMIRLRAFDACMVQQSALQKKTKEAVHSPCSCYANKTVDSMSKDELDAFRATGYFNDVTRAKAVQYLDECKLVRPRGV